MRVNENIRIFSVKVKFLETKKNVNSEGKYLNNSDVKGWRCGEQTGLETLVVHTVKDEC